MVIIVKKKRIMFFWEYLAFLKRLLPRAMHRSIERPRRRPPWPPGALLLVAGLSKLSLEGKQFADPEVLRRLTTSVSCALDEAAAALTRMRAEHVAPLPPPPPQGTAHHPARSVSRHWALSFHIVQAMFCSPLG